MEGRREPSRARSSTRPASRSPARKSAFVFADVNNGFFVTTKKNGEFAARDIKAGEWRMQVDAPNFIVVRQPITVADKNAPAVVVVKRDNSPELLTKADALFKAGQNAEARAEYLTVLAAHPELTAINRAIAFTYGREKNHPEALKYLDLALASNPNDATLLQLAAASAMQCRTIRGRWAISAESTRRR